MNIIYEERLSEGARRTLRETEIDIGKKIKEFERISSIKVRDIKIGSRSEDMVGVYLTEDDEDITDAITFKISKTERKKIKEWYESLIPEIMSKLKVILKDNYDICTKGGKRPYYGTICGPDLIYSFGITGLGDIIKVRETITGRELDLSDYDNW